MKTSKLLLFSLLFVVGQISFHAYAVPIIKTVGGTTPTPDYATLKLAFDAINAGTVTGDIELQIKDNITDNSTASLTANGTVMSITKVAGGTGYATPIVTISAPPEGGVQATATVSLSGTSINTFTITNPGSGYTSPPDVTVTGGSGTGATATAVISAADFNTLKIYPIVANKTIAGSVAGPLILINKANNVTFDGRLHDASGVLTGSTKDLTISNTFTAGNSMTIQFKYSASENAVRYCKIKGAGQNGTLAIITLSNPITATGCANIIISNNTFSASSGRPWTVIYSAGAATLINTGNKIKDNDIENCYVTTGATSCFSFGAFNSVTEISGNSFYETQTTAFNGNSGYNFISVTGGEGYTISNNYIGGSQPLCGGAFIKTCNTNLGNIFKGIVISSNITTGTASKIENNTIKNITWSSNGTGNAAWTGISVENTHNVEINGNTIGNISVTNAAAGSDVIGINKTNGTSNQTISKNFIYGLTSSAATTGQLYGIKVSGGVSTISNNIITLSTNNAIKINGIYETGAAGKNNSLYFNTVRIGGEPTSGALDSYAFYSGASTNTRDFRNNIFVNARSNGGTAIGKHFAAYLAYTVNTGLTINYNDYAATGTGGMLGYHTTGTYSAVNDISTLTAWKTATASDASSVNVDPGFAIPTGTAAVDFKPSSTLLVGVAGTGITVDFAGVRTIPTMGAWELVAAALEVPGAPTNIVAAKGNTQVSVSFDAPVSDGGSAITGYTVTPYIGLVAGTPVSGAGSPIVVTGLTNGTEYTFKVFATNAIGNSAESDATSPVTPDMGTSLINNDEKIVNIIRNESGIIVPLTGESIVELYTNNGLLIEKLKTNGAYTRKLADGMYIIRINGKATKFIK